MILIKTWFRILTSKITCYKVETFLDRHTLLIGLMADNTLSKVDKLRRDKKTDYQRVIIADLGLITTIENHHYDRV